MPLLEELCPFNTGSWSAQLGGALQRPCVIVAIGNRLRGDDAVGPEVLDRLKGRCRFPVLEGGLAPENLLGPLVHHGPQTILLIDAVHFGASPGSVRWFESEELTEVDISTHAMSPKLFLQQLQSQTGARVYLLGVQPKRREFGRELSEECRNAVEKVSQFLIELSAQVGT